MATVYFFEKPGCINNTRQKQWLTAAGHVVVAFNLLTEPWQKPRLRAFFGTKPVRDWFNYSAPAIRQGDVQPEQLNEAEALTLMIANPLLIKRPLMQSGDSFLAGFDQQQVDAWIGLSRVDHQHDLESCPRPTAGTCQMPS
jgi:nitrogenase-associated protein